VPNDKDYQAFNIQNPEGSLLEYKERLLKCEVVEKGKKKGKNVEKDWFLFGINRTA
jgi:hypothetical protein